MLSGQVGDAAGWWVAADAGVGSVVVVPVQPVGKRGLSFDVGGVGPLVGPFLKQGAVEAFDLAVGLEPPGPGPARADVQVAAGLTPGVLGVGPGVVGEDPFDRDAACGEPDGGPGEEAGGGGGGLVGQVSV